jgi:putative transcriptional regulator
MPKHAKAESALALTASLREAVQVERGQKRPARRRRVHVTARDVAVAPPRDYGAPKVQAIRKRLGLSQTVFATTLNVSPATVRAWEQGARVPDGPSRRLLEIADRHPDILLENLR